MSAWRNTPPPTTRWDNGESGGDRIIIKKSKTRFMFYVRNRYGTAQYDLKGYDDAQLKAWRQRILSGVSDKPFTDIYHPPQVMVKAESEEEE